MSKLTLVIKNNRTGEYSDGNYGWTMDLNKARRYLSDDILPSHDHIGFVELKNEQNKSRKKTSSSEDDQSS